MGAPFSLENTMRRHDEAFSLWLRGLTVDYGDLGGSSKPNWPILQVMAAPQRAFADLHFALVKQGFITGADAAAQKTGAGLFAVLPLPFVSWERGEPTPHPEYEGVPKRFRTQVFDQSNLTHVSHPWPGMYQTEYRMTLWCKNRYTEVHMREWVYSELGKIGTGHSEVWLPVVHADPWGTLKQSLRFTGSSDLSALEGEEDQRYFRYEFSFTFNTTHFRNAAGAQPYLDTIAPTSTFASEGDGVLEEAPTPGDPLVPAIESGNLYQPYTTPAFVSTNWPTIGNATVALSGLAPEGTSAGGALAITVDAITDAADLVNKPMLLDDNGQGVLHVTFELLSDATTVLDIFQNDGTHAPGDPPSWESCDQFTLPATTPWKRASFLTLVTAPVFDVSVRGSGTPAVARIANVVVRRVLPGTEIAPTTGPVVVGPNDVYTWTGLEPRPYLVLVELSGVGIGTLLLEDDDTSPVTTVSKTIDNGGNQGAVLLIQPVSSSMVLRVPTGLPIAPPTGQRYDGTYAGHEL